MARAGQLLARIAGNAVHARLAYIRIGIRASREQWALAREAEALLNFLRQSGCSFHPCSSLMGNPVPKGVAYRYDIHVRDIPGSLFFAGFHRKQNVPATFFLFWDYSPVERRYFRDYCALRRRISEPLEMGLHDSPVDAFLIKAKFDGNRRAYAEWADSERALQWLVELTSNAQALATLNDATLEDLVARVRQTRRHFGDFSLIAPHGGELWQNLRKRLSSLDASVAKTAQDLRAQFWFTPERLAAAGLELCGPSDQSPSSWRQISDSGGEISKMTQALRQRLRMDRSATQILLHPYTWTGGERDAELSEMLSFDSPPVAAVRS